MFGLVIWNTCCKSHWNVGPLKNLVAVSYIETTVALSWEQPGPAASHFTVLYPSEFTALLESLAPSEGWTIRTGGTISITTPTIHGLDRGALELWLEMPNFGISAQPEVSLSQTPISFCLVEEQNHSCSCPLA